ncbi:Nucleoporin [Podosphaera aphanis]|nr:Nucleoporin [Podosphaera aphanis]
MAIPATPQKDLPGSFFNTPAINRFGNNVIFNQLNSSKSSSTEESIISTTETLDSRTQQWLKPVQRAAKTINDVLQREASYPDLDSYLKQGSSCEYENPSSTSDSPWSPFQKIRMYDIPDRIFEQYDYAEVSTMMGLFAEINHAWVTIDNCMYLWDYTDPNPEVIGFEDQPNSITAVKLVVPRAGVFVAEVTHLLVVATIAEIILIGVNSRLRTIETKYPESLEVRKISLYATRMSLSIRGINVHVIESSKETGRIFFTGKADCSVYELTYQQEEKWFTNRCGKVNHSSSGYSNFVPAIWSAKPQGFIVQMAIDDSRGLLYTLSSESTICTFHMDTPTTLKQVIEKKRQEFLRDISHMISQSLLLTNSMQICNISPISVMEGSKLHLMASTTTGCRLFLSATQGYGQANDQGAPQSMQVQHIRFPPRIKTNSPSNSDHSDLNQYGPEQIPETSSLALVFTRLSLRFPPGLNVFLISKHESSGCDSLFVSAPDTGKIASQAQGVSTQNFKFTENSCWIPLASHAEDVGLLTKPFAATDQPVGFGNELATQYDEPCQEFAVLTNTGVHIIRRRRLVDIFASAIRNQGGGEGLENEIKKFIRHYGRAETTATALAVACGQGSDFSPGDARISKVSNPETLEIARKCFIEYGGRPTLNDTYYEGASQTVENVRPSSRHDGLAVYISRLVRSVWKSSIISISPTEGVTSTVAIKKLNIVQEDLMKLEKFLRKNKAFIEGLAGPESLHRVTSQQEEIALQGEHQALYSLQKLNSNIIEGISFVKVLFEEGIEHIWNSLDDEVTQRLRDLTFETLFSSDQGRDLAKVLVKAIVNRNISKGSNVDTVADALRRRCGSFCSADDVIIFKAQEQLKKASETGAETDMGRKLLNESHRLFMQVAGSLTFGNLQAAVRQFIELKFFAGPITLALLVAHESDRGNKALAWVNEGRPVADSRITLYHFRKQCYDLIYQILEYVDVCSGTEPDVIDGRQTLAATKRNEARHVVNDSNDELFHYELYDWYLNRGWEKTLLSVRSKYVVQYLKRSASTNLDRADLLWKFYQNQDSFYDAAKVQLELAKSDFIIPLSRRIEYLCRAKANASALSSQPQLIGRQVRQILQYEVTELLDVANIQEELLQRLKFDSRSDEKTRASFADRLDGQIRGLTVLYNEFADPASYYDICLTIYETASHRNDADIAATWQQLLDVTHTKVASDPSAGQLPYEAVITMIREMVRRLGLSESTFSPQTIIPMLEKYALEFQYQVGPPIWLPELFIEVGFTHETIVSVLQGMWYQNLAPFTGRRRQILSDHILYVIEQWYEQCIRSNGRVFGSDNVAEGIVGLLEVLAGSDLPPTDVDMCHDLRRRIEKAYR